MIFHSTSGYVIFAHNHIHLSLLCTWYLFICNGVMTSLIPRLFLLCCALSTPQHQLPMVPMLNVGAMWSLPQCGPWSIFHTQMNIRFNILILSGLNWLLHTALQTGGEFKTKLFGIFVFQTRFTFIIFWAPFWRAGGFEFVFSGLLSAKQWH